MNIGVAFAESGYQFRQDIDDGRFACGNNNFAGIQAAANFFFESVVDGVYAFDQWLSHVKELYPLWRKLNVRATPLEQDGLKFLLERLDLQADGRLAEVQLFGRGDHFAVARHRAKGPQLLERVALVVVPDRFSHKNSEIYISNC